MDKLNKNDIFNIPTSLWKLLGETERHTSVKLILFRAFNFTTLIIMFFFIFINFFRVSGATFIRTLQGAVTVSHVTLKYILFIYYKSDIGQLIESDIDNFLKYQKSMGNRSISFETFFKVVRYLQITLVTAGFLTLGLYILKPISSANLFHILETLNPNSIVLASIVLLSHYYFPYLTICIVFGYDLLYITLCLHMVFQMRCLKQKFRYLSKPYNENIKQEFGICIEYHHLLLLLYSRTRIIYSVMLFFHYFVTIATICSDFYGLVGNADLMNMLIEFVSFSFLVGQFACYAFPAEQVAAEFADLSNAIYMSKWYFNNVAVQKLLLFAMVNSQRLQYFSGGGLVDINVDAFGSVIRKTFSFYAVIKNVINK